MASSDALPIPRKNAAYRVTFPLLDPDGDLVTGASSLDSEVSKDGGTFTDCTNEATEIATNSGMYYLDLTSTEMNADTVAIIVKSASAKTTPIVLYPEEAGDVRVDVVQISGDSTAADNLETAADGGSFNLGGGGVVAASVTGVVGSVGANGISATSIATDAITAAKIAPDAIGASELAADAVTEIQAAVAAGAVASVTGAVGSVTGNVGGNVVGSVGSVVGAVGSVTGAVGSVAGNVGGNVAGSVGSVTAGVTVTTNNDKTGYTASTVSDKTGYSLSAGGVQAIWDALTAALTTVGSIGKLLVDNVNATISSRSAPATAQTIDLTQAIPDNPTDGTVGDALQAAEAQGFGKWTIVGTTLTLYRHDGVTVARTFTLDSASTPTSRT